MRYRECFMDFEYNGIKFGIGNKGTFEILEKGSNCWREGELEDVAEEISKLSSSDNYKGISVKFLAHCIKEAAETFES